MVRHQNFIDRALSLASTSQIDKFRHGAIVTHNNQVLGEGVNRRRVDPTIDYLHATFHAEILALKGLTLGRRVTLYVARLNRSGEVMLSRPCERCWEAIREAGVSEVVWSVPGGGYEVEKIRG